MNQTFRAVMLVVTTATFMGTTNIVLMVISLAGVACWLAAIWQADRDWQDYDTWKRRYERER